MVDSTCGRPGCGAHQSPWRTGGPHLFATLVPNVGVPSGVVYRREAIDGSRTADVAVYTGDEWVYGLPLPADPDQQWHQAVTDARAWLDSVNGDR